MACINGQVLGYPRPPHHVQCHQFLRAPATALAGAGGAAESCKCTLQRCELIQSCLHRCIVHEHICSKQPGGPRFGCCVVCAASMPSRLHVKVATCLPSEMLFPHPDQTNRPARELQQASNAAATRRSGACRWCSQAAFRLPLCTAGGGGDPRHGAVDKQKVQPLDSS